MTHTAIVLFFLDQFKSMPRHHVLSYYKFALTAESTHSALLFYTSASASNTWVLTSAPNMYSLQKIWQQLWSYLRSRLITCPKYFNCTLCDTWVHTNNLNKCKKKITIFFSDKSLLVKAIWHLDNGLASLIQLDLISQAYRFCRTVIYRHSPLVSMSGSFISLYFLFPSLSWSLSPSLISISHIKSLPSTSSLLSSQTLPSSSSGSFSWFLLFPHFPLYLRPNLFL